MMYTKKCNVCCVLENTLRGNSCMSEKQLFIEIAEEEIMAHLIMGSVKWQRDTGKSIKCCTKLNRSVIEVFSLWPKGRGDMAD